MNKCLSLDELGTTTPTASPWHEELALLLGALDDSDIECDSMTYAVSFALNAAGIEHRCVKGFVTCLTSGAVVIPHLWVELSDGWVVDMRLRMWLGDEDDVPHGVFLKEDHPRYKFEGKYQIRRNTINRIELDDMTDGMYSAINIPADFASENPRVASSV